MSSVSYRNFLRLLEKWPVDASKKGRDLGEYIRSGVAAGFRGGSDEPRDTETCLKIHASLNHISQNRYKEAFYVSEATSATGLSQQDCQKIISNEFLKELEEDNRNMKETLLGVVKKEK